MNNPSSCHGVPVVVSRRPDGAPRSAEPDAQRDSPIRILMIGAAVDQQTMDTLVRVDRIPQVQTYRFQWALIHGIERALGRAIDVIATVPTRDFPRTRKVWFGGKAQRREAAAEGATQTGHAQCQDGAGSWVQMPMVNLLGLKQIGRFLTCLWFTFWWLWRNRRCPGKVIVSYGLIVPHLCASQFLGRLMGAKVVAILTDPPVTYSDEGFAYRLARALDRAMLRGSLRRLDGVIALTPALAERFAPGVPALIMEGIISDEVERYITRTDEEPGAAGCGRRYRAKGRPVFPPSVARLPILPSCMPASCTRPTACASF